MLVALAVVQVLESKVPTVSSTRSRIFWIALKLVLGYVLIGYTGNLQSSYWLLLALPVLSAATALGVGGTLAVSIVAAAAYLSFYFFVNWCRGPFEQHCFEQLDPFDKSELVLRVVFLAMVGTLANALAEGLRIQTQRSRRTAEQLSAANFQIRQAEEAVRRSDRLAALGQLSAGLAHELRNPLGTIRASAEMLTRSVAAENEVAREVAGFISEEVDRTNSLVTRFLDFVRPLELRPAPADLAQVLDRSVAMVEREAAAREVTVYKNYSPDIPPFPLDAELMERVFYNLLVNAAQATAPGGAVTLKTRLAGDNAEISVIDRGEGIDPKLINTIFNPFFTTKSDGVGLGLAICSKIVDQHGGKIAVESEPGKGSVFHVYLPMVEAVSGSKPKD